MLMWNNFRQFIPKKIRDIGAFILVKEFRYDVLRKWKFRERKLRCGWKNVENTYYIIRRESPVEGIFSQVNYVMAHCEYAERHGWIPIVDMKNTPSILWDGREKKGNRNLWELYYKQPMGLGLEDVRFSRNIILGHGIRWEYPENITFLLHLDVSNKDMLTKWNRIYRKYIMLQPRIEEVCRLKLEEFFPKGSKILGAFCRIGIYNEKKRGGVKNYPNQISAEEMVEHIKENMAGKYEYCFLSTDDAESLKFMRSRLGDSVIFLDREKRGGSFKDKTKEEIFQDNIEYIIEIFLLSRCDGIMGSLSSGMINAFIQNGGKYEDVWIY